MRPALDPARCEVVTWGFYRPPRYGIAHLRDCAGECAAQRRHEQLRDGSEEQAGDIDDGKGL